MGMGNQKEEMKFIVTKEDCYHGVLHSSELNLLSLRIPKSACTYLRDGVFGGPEEIQFNQLKDFDISRPYEIFESLPFADTEYFSQYKKTPMIIFVRDPLERFCSCAGFLMNIHFDPTDNELPKEYIEHMEYNASKFAKYPVLIESIIADKISKSNTLYDLMNNIFGYEDYDGPLADNHLAPQAYWINEIMKVKDNLVFIEVNDFTHDNVAHYISNHIQKPFVTDITRANNSYDRPISMFTKSYLKAKICDVSSNSPLRQSALETYKEDIELYNRLKPEFYRGGEQ